MSAATLENTCNLHPKPKHYLLGKGNVSFDWYVWKSHPKSSISKRFRLMHNATMLDLVYCIYGFDPDEFSRHEIHTSEQECIFVWEESECPVEFMSFACPGQIKFAETVAPKYYKYLPPVGTDLDIMKQLFPKPLAIKMGPTFDFGIKILANNKSTSDIDDAKWRAGGFRISPFRYKKESRQVHESKANKIYVFGR